MPFSNRACRLTKLAVAVLALSACKLNPDAGEGPLVMNLSTKAGFDQYQRQRFPVAFAVSVDGKSYGYTTCVAAQCLNSEPYQAISYCQSSSKGVPCRLYAIGNGIVWDGQVTVRPDPTEPVWSRPIALRWEGYPELVAGIIAVYPNQEGGIIRIQLPNNAGTCQGRFTYDASKSGDWNATCTNGITASGSFTTFGSGKGSSGSGSDSNGRAIIFTIGGSGPTA